MNDAHAKLCELYRTMLSGIGMTVNADHAVCLKVGDDVIPMTHEGKTFVIPERSLLKAFDWNKFFIFHPLQEKANLPSNGDEPVETPIRMRTRKFINLRLNYLLGRILETLLNVNASPALHGSLRGEQRGLLDFIFTETSAARASKIFEAVDLKNPEMSFVHINYRARFQIGKTEYLNVGVVSFPLFEQVCAALEQLENKKVKENPKVFGVTVTSKADMKVLKDFLLYLFPGCDNAGQIYSKPSMNPIAPRFMSVLNAAYAVGEQIMILVNRFGDTLGKLEDFSFNNAWEAMLDANPDIMTAARALPMNAGGVEPVTQSQSLAQTSMAQKLLNAAQPRQQQTPMVQQPQAQVQTAQQSPQQQPQQQPQTARRNILPPSNIQPVVRNYVAPPPQAHVPQPVAQAYYYNAPPVPATPVPPQPQVFLDSMGRPVALPPRDNAQAAADSISNVLNGPIRPLGGMQRTNSLMQQFGMSQMGMSDLSRI